MDQANDQWYNDDDDNVVVDVVEVNRDHQGGGQQSSHEGLFEDYDYNSHQYGHESQIDNRIHIGLHEEHGGNDIEDVFHDDDAFFGGGDSPSRTKAWNYFLDRQRNFHGGNDDNNSWFGIVKSFLRGIRIKLFPWYNNNNNNNNAGIWIAVVVVLVFQFWPQIQDIIYSIETVGLCQTLQDVFVRVGNTVRAQMQLTIEFGRNIYLYIMRLTNIRRVTIGNAGRKNNHNNLNKGRGQSFSSSASSLQTEGDGRMNILDGIWGGGLSTNSSSFGSGFFFSSNDGPDTPPPLVTLVNAPDGTKQWKIVDEDDESVSDNRHSTNEAAETSISNRTLHQTSSKGKVARTDFKLEPSFSNEDDYPPGWVVYHHVLGVVTKEEADKNDSQTRQQSQLCSTEEATPNENQDKQVAAEKKTMDISPANGADGDNLDSNEAIDHPNRIDQHETQETGRLDVKIYDDTNHDSVRQDDAHRNGNNEAMAIGAAFASIPVAATGK